ncbi:MAG: TonB-dependent receptor [Bacteroidales bacterium]|nr:TonB-dependent receptor [Bacteroidales bacterium]
MKRFFLNLILLILLGFPILAQNQISGKVFDEENIPLPGAIIILNNGKLFVATDEFGNYSFKNLEEGTYELKAEYIGFQNETKTVYLKNDISIDFVLVADQLAELEKIIVSSTRAAGKTPIAFTTIDKNEIERYNLGQDIPYILKNTASMVVSSDAGTGIGYTQMRIRGTDMTRINVTLNGIPMNDPESHGVWWVDIPDFASSVDNIQIQRGVGTSSNGAGAFGASINLKTTMVNVKPSFEISNSFGSFNTLKNSISFGTGTINNHFVVDARLSNIHSDGFVDRARADMKSYYVSGTYFDNKTLLKATIFSGVENTYQAWNGVPKVRLESDAAGMQTYLDNWLYSQEEYDNMVNSDPRTYNFYTYENEIDYYQQTHYQLHFVRKLTNYLHFESSAFLIHGEGYYEQYKNDEDYTDYGLNPVNVNSDTVFSTDIIRQKWLDNNYYGVNYNLVYTKDRFNFVFGGGWNKYDGGHFGTIKWMQYAGNYAIGYEWYNNLGIKSDLNNYMKFNYDFADMLNVFGDFQYRVINYTISGIDDDLNLINQTHKFDFFNPKVGVLYHPNDFNNIYFSFAVAKREPSRTDFIDAPINKTPLEEKLFDYEFGYKLSKSNYSLNANFYYMSYDNQLIMTGEINDVGAAIVTNVEKSYRRGVELIFGAKVFNFLHWQANLSLSQNKIENFIEYVDDWDTGSQIVTDLGTTDLAFSPSIVANNVLSFSFLKYFNADVATHYVGKQYIDNTSSIDRSLNAYLVNDFSLRASFDTKVIKNISVAFKLNNFLNEKYETFAWVYSYYYGGTRYAMDGYFPQAGRNFMVNLTLKF